MISTVQILKKTIRTPVTTFKTGTHVKVFAVSGKGYAIEKLNSKQKVYDVGFDIFA